MPRNTAKKMEGNQKKRLYFSLILSRKPLFPSKGVNMKSVSRHVVLVYLLMLHP